MGRLLTALVLAMVVAASPGLAQTPGQATTARPAAGAGITGPARPVVPAKPVVPAVASPATAPDGKRIDLNSATESELDALPGVGPARAKALVANRPYDTLDAVAAKKALPANVLAALRGRVALANVNTSTAKDLQRTLPGIGDVRATQIVANRPYASPDELVTKGVLTQAAFDKVKDLVTY